ncbi:RND transporter [Luteitalea sp. TBR-22]|uniref:efflux transporter outer membrane subunit n=1 Tax=Luteitalea sp. TBR-22 TaxID=2802971 RepID=UPI001AFB9972|nr:efflux transporter outer membrane subunit [Luteitalea sp. TBR-22]BCS35694.1 RND transporter [Luteitalea sp. TBR-22]
MRKSVSVIVSIAALLAGCAVKVPAPTSSLPTPVASPSSWVTDGQFEARWWRQFQDPVLDALVTEAIAANRDLQAAAARVIAARELAGATRLNLLPTGGVAASLSRQHLSEFQAQGLELPTRTGTVQRAGIDVAWEADVFGRLRGRTRAAEADAMAAAMDARGVQVAVAAQVASAYYDWQGAERDLDILANLRQQVQDLLAKTSALIAGGRLTSLDLLRVRQLDDEMVAEQALVAHTAERARLRLATLTGRSPDGWSVPPTPAAALRARQLPIGQMTEVLARRPDVGMAQARLDAALARAGVARAELRPRIDVIGSIGLVAGGLGSLADAGALSWLAAPRIAWSVLDLPQLRRRARAAGALADAAFAEYEQATLRALEDVRTAVDAYGAATDRLSATQRRLDAASGAAAIVTVQYREGLVDSLARTLAERDRIVGELAASRALTAHQQAVVDVYRSLGGGWQ